MFFEKIWAISLASNVKFLSEIKLKHLQKEITLSSGRWSFLKTLTEEIMFYPKWLRYYVTIIIKVLEYWETLKPKLIESDYGLCNKIIYLKKALSSWENLL